MNKSMSILSDEQIHALEASLAGTLKRVTPPMEVVTRLRERIHFPPTRRMIVSRLRDALAAEGAEPAHLKTIGLWEGYHGVANLISSDAPAELSLASDCRTRAADVVVNARVATSPEQLTAHVEKAVREACAAVGATAEFHQTQSFRPGRPVPTHRFSEPAV